jgi:hypothetical protein
MQKRVQPASSGSNRLDSLIATSALGERIERLLRLVALALYMVDPVGTAFDPRLVAEYSGAATALAEQPQRDRHRAR